MNLKLYTFLGSFCLLFNSLNAQKTVQFRIGNVTSNLHQNMDDGVFCSNCNPSDPQWDYQITDNSFGIGRAHV